MSCYRIYYDHRTKKMLPVLTRDEYLRLRNSDENRRADKPHMLQMNYSCLPNDDGTLKGSKRTSTTVAMDIDIKEPSGSETPSAETLEMSSRIGEMILSKKSELGLLMLEKSARLGYHLAFRRHTEWSQEQNLRWAAELLGVEYDKAAKDITRVFFTPADKLVFLDDALFEIAEAPTVTETTPNLLPNQPKPMGHSKEKTADNLSTAQAAIVCDEVTVDDFSLNAFDLCVEKAGLKPDLMDIWGDHNWHNNLMAVLSVGLPKLMPKAKLLAVVRERLRNYSQTDDCMRLIDYFYENYSADRGFMSETLREINAKAQENSRPTKNATVSTDDEELDALTEGWEPPELPKKIPRIMELLVSNYDPKYREMLLLSALPVLSAHASHFRATYLNNDVIGPQQFVVVIGGSGQGKGNCSKLYKEMTEHTLDKNDREEWDKVKKNAELRDQMQNASERPPKYHPKLRLFEVTSKTSVLELQSNLGKNGMLLGMFSEADGLSTALNNSFSNINVMLRKGWEGETHRQYYMSESTCNSYVALNISLLMSGTVKSVMKRVFSDDNCESGLMQRFIPVMVPKTERTFRPPLRNCLLSQDAAERDRLLLSLYEKDRLLGDDTEVLETPKMLQAIGSWFDELEQRYNDGLLTEAEADLSHRCGEFMLKAAIPLIAMYGKETKEIVTFCRWVGEMAHYMMCRLFGHRVQNDLTSAAEMTEGKPDQRKTAIPLLNQLPNVFNKKQFIEVRIKAGQSSDVNMILSRYCKQGKLNKIGRGVYQKRNVIN